MPAEHLLICTVEEIADPGSRGFSIQLDDQSIEGFVVQKDGQFYAYRNSCPHTGSPLDWVEHQFLDLDQALIQCAVHDARFEIESGLCLAGPCHGNRQQKLPLELQQGKLYLSC